MGTETRSGKGPPGRWLGQTTWSIPWRGAPPEPNLSGPPTSTTPHRRYIGPPDWHFSLNARNSPAPRPTPQRARWAADSSGSWPPTRKLPGAEPSRFDGPCQGAEDALEPTEGLSTRQTRRHATTLHRGRPAHSHTNEPTTAAAPAPCALTRTFSDAGLCRDSHTTRNYLRGVPSARAAGSAEYMTAVAANRVPNANRTTMTAMNILM